jgi:hypothetical protein
MATLVKRVVKVPTTRHRLPEMASELRRHDKLVDDAMRSEVAVDVHALVQDAHNIDDALGGDPIEQRL